jgi:hypothetical protein
MTTPPTDAEIARAQALGRLAARAGVPASRCPYTDPVLRLRYTLAYAGAAVPASNGQEARR